MTREIKFRMWSEEAGKYFRYPQVFECLMQQYCHDNNVNWLKHDHSGDGMVFEQYTGLKDKNGKEIYEGDILKYSAHYFGDSLEKQCIEVVVWDVKEACYPWKLTSTGFSGGPEWREIIGNIHETQELVP